MSNCVMFGPVVSFDKVDADKEHAVKVLEEAAEVFGAWQTMTLWKDGACGKDECVAIVTRERLLNECCDVVQAVANLCAGLGYSDMTEFMQECTRRNVERGRIS